MNGDDFDRLRAKSKTYAGFRYDEASDFCKTRDYC